MITPRRTRLLRVSGLRAFTRALAQLACPPEAAEARACAVVVPSAAAASELRLTLENLLLLAADGLGKTPPTALVLPDLVTRDGWYARLHDGLPAAPPVLSPLERDVLADAAARDAVQQGFTPPFKLRAGLVSELLAFYDDLRRHRRTIDAFERLAVEELEPRASIDRGAERLLRQTRFLVATFRAYERRLASAGVLDEHALRDLLLQSAGPGPYRCVVVTVGDRVAEQAGLYSADFDLLTRLEGVERLEVVATEESLDAGLGERLREMLPGIEETRWTGGPEEAPPAVHAFSVSRDREDELAGVARRVREARRSPGGHPPLDRTAVVFRRPLPYVYLAQTVFESAGVPYQAADALPLAAEPYAAAVNLAMSVVTSGFRRAAVTALLSCPLFVFDSDGAVIDRPAALELDLVLAEAGFLGGMQELAAIAAGLPGRTGAAARAAAEAASELAVLAGDAPASAHLDALLAFLKRHDRWHPPDDPAFERHRRARAAIVAALETLRAAHVRHDDPVGSFPNVAATLRRWIEAQTFSPRCGSDGVHLVDAPAARYGDFDDVFLVGLVDADWPGGSPRNIFYPSALLSQLGWPSERAHRAGVRAAFLDLLTLAERQTTVSAFTLEDDALVSRSALLEEVESRARLPEQSQPDTEPRIFTEEALTADPVRADVVPEQTRPWLTLRQGRLPASDARFHGQADPYEPDCWSVSAVDVYVECPFRFFAKHVLKLEEEPEDEEGLTPRERGRFVHEVLRAYFAEWQKRGGAEITPDNLDEARHLFAETASRALDRLPATDAAMERPRLLGSAATPGAGEIVLGFEAASAAPVADRLFEHRFEGTYELQGNDGPRRLCVRGIIDRLDLLADGRVRVVDYKTGRAPDHRRSVQLPVYAVCAAQELRAKRGGRWEVAEAVYLAFTGRDNVSVAIGDNAGGVRNLAVGQQRFLDAVDGIGRGEFPPRPFERRICSYCKFAWVCRKEYVGDE